MATQQARFTLPLDNDFAVANAIYANAKASGTVSLSVLDGWYNGAMEYVTGDEDLARTCFHDDQNVRDAFFWGTRGKVPHAIIIAARAYRAGVRAAA